MAREVFVDTSGFFALLVSRDEGHGEAKRILQRAAAERRRFVTTEYVLDETATLLKARRMMHLVARLFQIVLSSPVCGIEWTDAERFRATQRRFLTHVDHAWSFTDCLSFQVMNELHLRDALTKDEHFREAGFIPLLAASSSAP